MAILARSSCRGARSRSRVPPHQKESFMTIRFQPIACATVRLSLLILCLLAPSLSAKAGVQPFPAGFRSEEIKTEGATIHVRVGGQGPAIVMLHGFGDTGDMWAPVAAALW